MNNKIWIKTKCNNYYKLISKIDNLNITIYDCRYSDYIYLYVTYKDYLTLKKYLVSYKFSIYKLTGINKLKDILKSEKIFIISLLIGLITLILLSNMIFKIEIIHENKDIRDLIKEELDNYDIKVLHFKKSYKDLNKIRKEILDKYPDKLDWMEFVVNGLNLSVKVEERIITDINKDNSVCDIIAKKSGVISDIYVESGEVQVQINDYVKKGDTLVKGIINYNNEDKRYTCAKADIYITTWYTVSITFPMEKDIDTKTNKKRYNLTYEINDNKHNIFKSRLNNYTREYKKILDIFNFKLYIEKDIEIKKERIKYTEEEAINNALSKAEESLKKKLSKKDSIIDKKVLKKSKNNSTMDIEVFLVVKELISAQNKIEIKKD